MSGFAGGVGEQKNGLWFLPVQFVSVLGWVSTFGVLCAWVTWNACRSAKKMCLLENGSETKSILSLLEKDIKSELGGPCSSDLLVQDLTNN
jgi:hypothetical protein